MTEREVKELPGNFFRRGENCCAWREEEEDMETSPSAGNNLVGAKHLICTRLASFH